MHRTHQYLTARLTLTAVVSLLAGCHHASREPATQRPGSRVSYQPVADQSAGHYELTLNQGTTGADMVPDNPAPEYPAGMIEAARPPVVIDALLIVGRDGHVHEVRIAGDAAEGKNAPFARAVAAATPKWCFTPFRITTWQDTPDGGSRRIAAKAEPFSQNYRFNFSIIDGTPAVTTNQPGC